jgi:ubiquinone/menaquinone biosynthesis C-methylase UbiE
MNVAPEEHPESFCRRCGRRTEVIMILDFLLSNPVVFDWQQRLCNHYGSVREHFRDYLEVSGKDILDIGCSTGVCARQTIPLERNRYVGIDIEPKYVQLAAKRCPAGQFLVMDARDMTFDASRFDVVLFVGALHHMDNTIIKSCFREIRRVLRDDGVVLCAEPVFTPGKRLSTLLLKNDRGQYIRTEEGYRSLFEGFQVERQDYLRLAIHRFCSFVLSKQTGETHQGNGR